MRLLPFSLPEGFRQIERADIDKEFQTLDPRMDNYTLADYYEWSLEPNTYSIVYEPEDEIWVAMTIKIEKDFVSVEMLGRNVPVAPKGTGRLMMAVVEAITDQMRMAEVRLESLDSVIEFYHDLGYEQYAEQYEHEEFGVLTPMRKRL